MDAKNFFRKYRNTRTNGRLGLILGAIPVAMFAAVLDANAKCSLRVADPLITARYQGCNQKALISYLYNDLITPYSFTCAKKISETCREANCAKPATPAAAERCLNLYVNVLNECPKEIENAALMARCKDAKMWSIEAVAARITPVMKTAKVQASGLKAPTMAPTDPIQFSSTPMVALVRLSTPTTTYGPNPLQEAPVVTAEPLPADFRIVRKNPPSNPSSRIPFGP